MIPPKARPHEVAILMLKKRGFNVKQIAHLLHYKKTQPVRRVITKWEIELTSSSID